MPGSGDASGSLPPSDEAGGDASDGFVWETSKENVRPIKRGRSVAKLSRGLALAAAPGGSAADELASKRAYVFLACVGACVGACVVSIRCVMPPVRLRRLFLLPWKVRATAVAELPTQTLLCHGSGTSACQVRAWTAGNDLWLSLAVGSYIAWVETAYPSGGGAGQLLPLLERATRALHGIERYRNSVDYMKMWIQYVSCRRKLRLSPAQP